MRRQRKTRKRKDALFRVEYMDSQYHKQVILLTQKELVEFYQNKQYKHIIKVSKQ